jgi:uncharacterized repeat protein (TIGR02543 family)
MSETIKTIKISELSDDELCKVISTMREPKPQKPGYVFPTWTTDSTQNNWYWKIDVDANIFHGYWNPINWLAPENWTRLLEEMKDKPAFHLRYFKITDNWLVSAGDVRVLKKSKERAVCEVYAVSFGEGKYE